MALGTWKAPVCLAMLSIAPQFVREKGTRPRNITPTEATMAAAPAHKVDGEVRHYIGEEFAQDDVLASELQDPRRLDEFPFP